MTPEEINKIIDEEVYFNRYEGTYDHGDAVARVMALAADRIEQLEAALREISRLEPNPDKPNLDIEVIITARKIARAALQKAST